MANNLEDMVSRYIITAAEYGARPNHPQLDAYETYAKQNDAQIIVIPIEGQYLDMPLHERFGKYVCTNDMSLGKNISIKDFRVRAQQINPLTGLRRFGTVDKSIIVGSPKQHLEHVANSQKNKPKAVMSTGACTLPHYKSHLRIGRVAEEDHMQGGILLEVEDDGYFHFRQAQNISDGSFIDCGIKYSPNGSSQFVGIDALVLGDLHDAQKSQPIYERSLGIINELQPNMVFLHDIFDGYSITHHDKGRQLVRAKKAGLHKLSLFQELYSLGETLEEIAAQGKKETKYFVVKSNHDEALDKFLDEGRFGGDAENYELSVRLAAAYLEGKDPIQEGIKLTYGRVPKNVKFLQRDDELNRYGFNLSSHGDKGPSGSRGSLPSFDYSLGKAFIAHNHSAAIRKNIYRVGTTSILNPDYTAGTSGNWTHTHGIVNRNGKAQLININNGKYWA